MTAPRKPLTAQQKAAKAARDKQRRQAAGHRQAMVHTQQKAQFKKYASGLAAHQAQQKHITSQAHQRAAVNQSLRTFAKQHATALARHRQALVHAAAAAKKKKKRGAFA